MVPPPGTHAPRITGRLARVAIDADTTTAAGLAGAQLAANGIAVVFTVVFARLLGREDYGALAALTSTFLILSVPGYALQVAAARATATGRLGDARRVRSTLHSWARRLLAVTAVLAVAGALVREPLAALIGVDGEWAAAATLPTGGLWLLLSIQRGVLAGLGAYRPVGVSIAGEAAGRLVLGVALTVAGLGITGAYLGMPLAMAAASVALAAALARRAPAPAPAAETWRLRRLAREATVPIAALALVGALQNLDVIIVRHQVPDGAAGAYAAAAVAAKIVVWTAVGVGLYLLPEAARRAAAAADPRPVLLRALAVVGAIAAPALAVFAIAPELVLRVGFGAEYTRASDALVLLGIAMSLLGLGYLAVQFLLAIGSRRFLLPLAAVAAAEPLLLLAWDIDSIAAFAGLVLAVQLAAALAVLVRSLRRTRSPLTVPASA